MGTVQPEEGEKVHWRGAVPRAAHYGMAGRRGREAIRLWRVRELRAMRRKSCAASDLGEAGEVGAQHGPVDRHIHALANSRHFNEPRSFELLEMM